MAERRRRRQGNASQEILSEGESQEADELSADSDQGSEHDFVDMSEYDSAEDDLYEDEKTTEQVADEEIEVDIEDVEKDEGNERKPDEEAASQRNDDDDDDGMRESGDGKSDNDQESKLHNKVLKIAEDRNSPLFIPTKGNFYMHDVRSDAGSRSRRGGRIQNDFSKDRWLHDKYNEDEQTSKSREDLIEEYGYDMRSRGGRGENTAGRRGRRPGGRRGLSRGNISNMMPRNEMPEPRHSTRRRARGGSIRSRNFHARRSRSPPGGDHETDQSRESAGDEGQLSATEVDARPSKKDFTPTAPKPTREATKSSKQADVPEDSTASDVHNSILDVINNREQEKAGRRVRERGYSHQRHVSKPEGELTERMKNMSLNKESVQPKRYSSLRQRATEPPGKAPRHSAGRNRPSEPPRHFPPQIPAGWAADSAQRNAQQSRAAQQDDQRQSTNEPPVPSNVGEQKNYPPILTTPQHYTTPRVEPPSETVEARMPPGMVAPPMNITKMEPSSTADSASLAQLQWYEAALAYQQAMLSQSLLNSPNFLPHHTPPHDRGHAVGDAPLLLNTESQAATPPQHPPLPPAVGQGDIGALGSVVFPPPIQHEYQNSNFIQRNLLPERPVVPPSLPVQFPPTPNLMAQQVGGVTYYPNPLQPMQNVVHGVNPLGSPVPRLNAAIPIRYPIE